MWWGVLSELAETKNNFSAFNTKKQGWQSQKLKVASLTAVRQCGGVSLVGMASTVC